MRVSADRAARPSPHTRGKPRLLDVGRRIPARDRFAPDSPVEQRRFELVWGFSCQVVIFGLLQFFVRSGKAVLHPVAYDQVRGARGRGQGTETLAKLGGLPLSVGCVSQRLDA